MAAGGWGSAVQVCNVRIWGFQFNYISKRPPPFPESCSFQVPLVSLPSEPSKGPILPRVLRDYSVSEIR